MPTLADEKERLLTGEEKSVEKIIMRFMAAIDNHEWLLVPCFCDDNMRLIIEDHYGKKYIALYSSEKAKKVAKDMISADVNKVIDKLFADAYLSGIVLDKDDNPLYIERSHINSYSSRKDPRLVLRHWSSGIPEYDERDLKTSEEFHDFAMSIIDGHLENNGYIIEQRNNFSSWFVNYVAIKDGAIYYICVEAGIAPNIPTLSQTKKAMLINSANKGDAIPLYASLTFGSTDKERFNSSLALCGDGYYARFTGLEEVLA